jgi:hypothetical protein
MARRFTGGALARPMNASNDAQWSVLFRPVTPDGFFVSYMPALCSDRCVRTIITRSHNLVVYLIYAVAGGGSVVARRVIHFQKKYAFHHYLISHHIADDTRMALQITPRLMRAAIAFYDSVGISVVYLKAGLLVGGRLWPKYGFRPLNSHEWLHCAPRIISNLEKLPSDVQNRWGLTVRRSVSSPDPSNLQTLYRLDEMVPDLIDSTRKRRLGPVLMTGTQWKGVLDLRDPDSRTILEDAFRMDARQTPAAN